PCQNEAARGRSSASRLTASSSCSSEARSAAGFDVAGSRNSRTRSSAVTRPVVSSSDDRARRRNASMHKSTRLVITGSTTHYTSAENFLTEFAISKRPYIWIFLENLLAVTPPTANANFGATLLPEADADAVLPSRTNIDRSRSRRCY